MKRNDVVVGLGALAQSTRLDIVRFLVRRGCDGATAGEVSSSVGVAAASLTFHLNILTGAGLLLRRRSGRNVIYRADFARLHRMTAYLLENCCAEEAASAGEQDEKLAG